MLTFLQLGRLGRLGNEMFQIASTIGMATRHSYQYGFPYWRNYDHAERFYSVEDIDIQKYFLHSLPSIPMATPFRQVNVDFGFHQLSLPDQNISLWGHLQSEKYFAHCQDLVRHYFTFASEYLRSGRDMTDAVGVHIRRGDYDNNYHPFCTEEYYEQALALFPADTRFVVFSDDIPRARGIIGSNAEYVEGLHYMEDLYLMTRCRDFVISNSTFSWWGAWLIQDADKLIVSPSAENWFGKVAGCTGHDIIPASWVQIPF